MQPATRDDTPPDYDDEIVFWEDNAIGQGDRKNDGLVVGVVGRIRQVV